MYHEKASSHTSTLEIFPTWVLFISKGRSCIPLFRDVFKTCPFLVRPYSGYKQFLLTPSKTFKTREKSLWSTSQGGNRASIRDHQGLK